MEQSIVSNNATIVSIEGTAFAVAPDGSLRELQPGDQLLAGEMLITGEGTQIGFYYSDDQYELGELSVTQLPEDGVAEPGQTLSAQNEVDVEALQAAILEGVDPTELFEATAAGGAPAAGGGGPGAGNGGFISISRSGAETIAEAGFDTSPVTGDEQQQQDNVAVLADDTPSQSATLTLTTSDVTEDDATITFTATLSQPTETAMTVVTDLGTIEIAAGESSGTLVVTNPNTSDVYLDAGELSATVTSVSGGSFAEVDFAAANATAQISDTIDTTTVSLSTSDVSEADGSITFTATLSNPGQTAVTVVTDLGTIEIAAGETSGSLTVDNPNTDDVYLDASSLTATVSDVQGGNFENVDFSAASATAQIGDTIDTTTVSLSTSDVTEAEGTITFTATLSNPGQSAVTVVTDLGNIEIAAGETTGSLTVDNPNGEDVYLDASSLTASIIDVQGGGFENVDISGVIASAEDMTATSQIGDTIDTTTVSLSTSDVSEADGTITFTATLSNPGQSAVTVVTDLGNIEIAAGETEGTLVVENPNGEDVYLDASSLTATVTDVQGGNFESVDFDGVSATAQIGDTIDTTTVSLSTSDVTEADGTITFTATLSNPGQSAVTVVTDLGNIEIAAGETTGSLTVENSNGEDVYLDASLLTATVTDVQGGNFERVDFDGVSATAQIGDTVDTTTVSLTTSDVSESDDGTITFTATLSNPGQTAVTIVTDLGNIEIAAGETEGTLVVDNPNGEDVYLDASSLTATVTDVQGGNFENVDFDGVSATAQIGDTLDTTTVSLTTSDVSESDDGTITFTATLSNPGQTAVTVVTDLGNIEIAAGETEGTLVVDNPNGEDVYLDASSLTATVTDVQGGNFENVDFDGVSATAQIGDTVDTTTVSLTTSNVSESDNGTITFTATLSNPGQTAVTVVTDLGNIEIAAGETEGTLVVDNPNGEDVYLDASSLTATVTDVQGGNFESVDFDGVSATAQIGDTVDTTTVSLTTSDVSESDNGTITFTATLNNPGQTAVTVVTDLGNIEIAAGETEGTLVVDNPNGEDVYLDASSLTATVTDVQGGNFESIDFDGVSATSQIGDTINTTNAILSVSSAQILDGGELTYTITLDSPTEGEMEFELSNGVVITIADGESTGSGVYQVDEDVAPLSTEDLTVSISSSTGGNFEDLEHGPSVTTEVSAPNTPPKATDFSVSVSDFSEIAIEFDPDSDPDRVSDLEDDLYPDDGHVLDTVVIQSLPTMGILSYNGEAITQQDIDDQTEFDLSGITYQPHEDLGTTSFLLGAKDSQSDLPSEYALYSWGRPTDDPKVRELTLEDGSVVTISSEGSKGGALQHYDREGNHVGYGIGDKGGSGIQKNESISIDFGDSLQGSLELGMDGLGGLFEAGDDNAALITITYRDPLTGEETQQVVEYLKPEGETGRDSYFQAVTVGNGDSFDIDTQGQLIAKIEFSTENSGNWVLRYVESNPPGNDSFDYAVIDSHGEPSNSATVTLDMDLEQPATTVSSNTLFIEPTTVVVDNLEGGFENATFTDGPGSYNLLNQDGDSFADKLRWGQGSGQSAYVLSDSIAFSQGNASQVQVGEHFTLGEFTHENRSIPAGTQKLESVDLKLQFDVTINGETYAVEFVAQIDHEETPNTGPGDSRDIITLPPQSQTIEVDGTQYVVVIDGFFDTTNPDAGAVSTILTDENADNTFEIVAHIESLSTDMPQVGGAIDDDAAVAILWDGAQEQGGVTTVDGEHGQLQVSGVGDYVFTASEETRDSISEDDVLFEQFSYQATDAEGNTYTDVLTLVISGGDHNVVEGSNHGETVLGSDATNDVLLGGAGDDVLYGGDGNDVLVGGEGNDILIGGEGIDTFSWLASDASTSGDAASDVIEDFTVGSGGDVLDLSDLLQGETEDSLTDYLSFERVENADSSVDTVVSIDIDGSDNGAEVHQTITLKNVDFNGMSDQAIIDQLLEDQQLQVDNN